MHRILRWLPTGATSVACAASLCLFAGASPTQTPRAPQRLDTPATIDGGPCGRAESEARRLVAEQTATHGENAREVAAAEDRLVEALLRNGKGTQPSTRELAERIIRLRGADSTLDPLQLAPSLRNLASILSASGDHQQAVDLLQRALTLRERARGDSDPSVAESLDDLGYAQILGQKYDQARHTLDRALAIKEALLDPDPPSVARTLEGLALLLQKQAKYADARPLLERALTIRESLGSANPDLPETLYLSGDQQWFEGRFSAARALYARAVGGAEATCGEGHPRLPVYLRNLAATMARLGDIADAITTGERALRLAEANLGSDDPEVAANLNGLAIREKSLGNYAKARALYERTLQIVTRRLGPYHDYVASTVHNLAVLSAEIGDFAEAKRHEDRAVAVWEHVLGPGHPFVATALAALADVLSDQGRYQEARTLYERALTIWETKQPGYRDLPGNQMSLARTLLGLGDVRGARNLSDRALARLEDQNADDLPLARALVIRANLELAWGDSASARVHYERGLTIRERILGAMNPLVADARAGLGDALARTGDLEGAFDQALRAEAIGRGHVILTVRYLSERQSLSYAAKRPKALDLALSVSNGHEAAGNRALDALIRSRALVLDEMAARRRVSTDASRPDVGPLWAALASARQRLANLVVKGPSDQRPQEYVTLVEEARHEKELAERALAEKSAAFNAELAQAEIGLDGVRAALPPDAALVSFVRYDRTPLSQVPTTGAASTRPTNAVRTPRAVPSYLAFVVRRDQPPSVIHVGSAATVDGLIAAWRVEVASGVLRSDTLPGTAEDTYRTVATRLRRQVWDPIASRLAGVTRVFVVPDGSLNLLALDSLPVTGSKYLIDGGRIIHYLSAERDLVAAAAPSTPGRGLLAIGGPAFDVRTSPAAHAVSSQSTMRSSPEVVEQAPACDALQTLRFYALPASLREAGDVVSLWNASGSSGAGALDRAQVLAGREATERMFKQRASGTRVLHIATHGFVVGNCRAAQNAPGAARTRQSQLQSAGLMENPLLRSGLALAGANRRALAGPTDEDGILTAEEVAALNLEGVEWAVLSACGTGLGEVAAGEGVLGLRRAFQIAGARTIIMSLWSVEDQATRLWMRALYEARLRKHLSTADAVHDASLRMLRERRARGQSTHPFYWAGFVAAGDWR